MIIKRADIEGFGKFTNKSIEFDRGFNLITGANEDGKTTFMSFIKMMFYSSSGKTEKGQDLLKIPRKKYRPWSDIPMAGAIEFEKNGMEYRLHKQFLKSEASDKTSLFCKTTGEEEKIENLNEAGEYLFDMSLGEFERSVFIGSSGGFSSDASADSLAMRISNLSVSGDENTSQSLIIKRLSEAIEELVSRSGKKGLLVDAEAKLEALKFELQQLLQQEESQKALFEEIAQIEKEILENEELLTAITDNQKIYSAKKDLNAFFTLSNKINLRENILKQLSKYGKSNNELKEQIHYAKKLEHEISQTLSHLEELSSKSSSNQVSEAEFSKAEELDKSASAIRADLEILRGKVSNTKSAFEEASKRAIKTSKLLVPTIFGIMAALGIGLILAGTVTELLLATILGGAVLVCGIIISVILSRIAPKKALKKPSLQFLKRDFETALRMLSNFSEDMMHKTTTEIESQFNTQLSDTVSALDDILSRNTCKNLAELKAKTGLSKAGELAAVTTRLNNQKEQFILYLANIKPVDSFVAAKILFNEIIDSFDTLSNVSSDIDTIISATGISDTSEVFVKEQIKVLTDFLQNTVESNVSEESTTEIQNKLRELRAQLGTCQSKIHLPQKSENEINAQIRDAEAYRDELKERFDELSIANEVMAEAITETNKGLGSHLSKKTGEYLSAITKGRYNDVLVSRNLNVEARGSDGEAFRDWKYLSGGAIDRVYLALRLAATDILTANGEPLPLFLDDILSQYDDENCKSALEFLKEYLNNKGSVSQLLFFTCHGYIADLAKSVFTDARRISL